MPNPFTTALSVLRGDHIPRREVKAPPIETPAAPVAETKLYYYPDYLNPSVATDPDINAAIRLGTLVHGPGATEMYQSAWHQDDSNSAIFACLSAIATAFPEAAPKVYRQTAPGKRDELEDHPLRRLLDDPNPYHTRENMWHWTQWVKHVNGNAYWRKVRSGSSPESNVVQLWPISPSRIVPVTIKADADRGIFISYYSYTFDPAQDPELIPPEDIIHFRLGIDDRDHRIGCSPLARLVRERIGDDEAHKWQTSMLENGGTAGMMIQVPVGSNITTEQAEQMKASFEERFTAGNRGRTGVLMGGASAAPYGFSPEQMDMRSLHRIPEERIAAVLRVPAIIAGLGAGLDRSTYSNYREAREMFAEMTILPLYSFDAATLNKQLKGDFTNDPRLVVMFDTNDLRAFQEDEDAKWKRLDTAVKTGWVRPNEARTDVGLPPDMDDEAPLRSQPLPAAPQDAEGEEDDQAGPEDDEGAQRSPRASDARPAGARSARKQAGTRIPSDQELEVLPTLFAHIAHIAEEGTARELEEYFDGQSQRVKSKLGAPSPVT
jgi:HK97 family phage portal protein